MELIAIPISVSIAYVFYLVIEKRYQTKLSKSERTCACKIIVQLIICCKPIIWLAARPLFAGLRISRRGYVVRLVRQPILLLV
jgi:hypothetical protein